jgi:hypothetical protein
MRIAYPMRIVESEAELAALEKRLRGPPTAPRVQLLRLLKSGTVSSVLACAPVLGYSRTQLQRWWATIATGAWTRCCSDAGPPANGPA